MKIIPANESFSVKNFDLAAGEGYKHVFKKHGNLFPNDLRAILVGSSACGKTSCFLSLLLEEKGLKYCNVYLFSKSLSQPKYQFLKEVLESVEGVGYYPCDNMDEIKDPSMLKKMSVVAFDDICGNSLIPVRNYFSHCRHFGIDTFLLIQCYTSALKQSLRDNANFLCLWKMDLKNLTYVFNEHVLGDMDFKKFVEIASFCWKDKHGFMVIDKTRDVNDGRYRKGFDQFISLV